MLRRTEGYRGVRLKVASWNVNSIRVRLDRLVGWLGQHQPDVLCLQETKSLDAAFPLEPVAALGYQAALFGQKAYNGVAILSRLPMDDLARGLDDGEEIGGLGEARLIAATIAGVRIHSVYVPNGSTIFSDKYLHKLRWFDRLAGHVRRLPPKTQVLLCGDFNVAPDERDLYNPAAFSQDVIFHAEVRAAYARLTALGLVDTFRRHQPAGGHFSWWDYRMLALQKNRGLRIDLILASAALAERCVAAAIDREARQGSQPSDHAPILAEFELAAEAPAATPPAAPSGAAT